MQLLTSLAKDGFGERILRKSRESYLRHVHDILTLAGHRRLTVRLIVPPVNENNWDTNPRRAINTTLSDHILDALDAGAMVKILISQTSQDYRPYPGFQWFLTRVKTNSTIKDRLWIGLGGGTTSEQATLQFALTTALGDNQCYLACYDPRRETEDRYWVSFGYGRDRIEEYLMLFEKAEAAAKKDPANIVYQPA